MTKRVVLAPGPDSWEPTGVAVERDLREPPTVDVTAGPLRIRITEAEARHLRDWLVEQFGLPDEEPTDYCNDCGVPIEGAHGHCPVEPEETP